MSSPAEESSTSAAPERAAPAAVPEPGVNGSQVPAAAEPSGEAGMWSAVDAAPKDFDELAAEHEASKVFALWEIAPALAQPAAATAQKAAAEKEAPDVWGVAPATEKMDAPPAPVIAMAPLGASSSAQVTGEYGASDAAVRLPEAKGTRNAMLAAVALVALIAIGGGIAMFSGGDSTATPTAPVAAAPPAVARPTVVAPTAAAPAPAAVAPVVVAPAAVAPAAVAPVVVAPAVVEPVAVVTPEVAPMAEIAPAPPAPAPVAVAPVTVVAPVVAPAAVVPPAPPPPALHHLRIRTVPASAALTVDGARVPNPYDGRLPEGTSHTVVATAPDHQSRTETLAIGRRDHETTLRLERIPAPPPVAAPPRVAAQPATTARRTTERRRAAASIRPRTGGSSSGSSGSGFVTESPY